MGAHDEVGEWIRSRPEKVQRLMLDFPPGCVVRAKPGIVFMAPAPGVEGVVVSYREDGILTVQAPLDRDVTSPATGQTLKRGTVIGGKCDADKLELVRCDMLEGLVVDRAYVEAALRAAS